MKRYGNLYQEIINFENILIASRQAQKSKRFRDNVLDFNYHLETELIKLQIKPISQELTEHFV